MMILTAVEPQTLIRVYQSRLQISCQEATRPLAMIAFELEQLIVQPLTDRDQLVGHLARLVDLERQHVVIPEPPQNRKDRVADVVLLA